MCVDSCWFWYSGRCRFQSNWTLLFCFNSWFWWPNLSHRYVWCLGNLGWAGVAGIVLLSKSQGQVLFERCLFLIVWKRFPSLTTLRYCYAVLLWFTYLYHWLKHSFQHRNLLMYKVKRKKTKHNTQMPPQPQITTSSIFRLLVQAQHHCVWDWRNYSWWNSETRAVMLDKQFVNSQYYCIGTCKNMFSLLCCSDLRVATKTSWGCKYIRFWDAINFFVRGAFPPFFFLIWPHWSEVAGFHRVCQKASAPCAAVKCCEILVPDFL